MAKPIKYTAAYNGKIVGERRSPRPYQFAIITQESEAAARKKAYDYEPSKVDQMNFDWHMKAATATEGARKFPEIAGSAWSAQDIEDGKRKVEGGWDAYVARCRANAIKWFEERKAKGGFDPQVFGWSMSQRNAAKMAATAVHPSRVLLGIVPAEVK